MDLQLTLTEAEAAELYQLLSFHSEMLDEDDERQEATTTLLEKVAAL